MKQTGAKKRQQAAREGEKYPCADLLSVRSAGSRMLMIQVPCDVEKVIVNGVLFHRDHHEHIVTRVAPIKYGDDLFKQVDALFETGLTRTAACGEVAEKHGFSVEGFSRQYRDRWLNRKSPKSYRVG